MIATSSVCLLNPQNTHPTGTVILWFLHICYKSLASIKWVIVMSEGNWFQCLCLYKVNKKHSGFLRASGRAWLTSIWLNFLLHWNVSALPVLHIGNHPRLALPSKLCPGVAWKSASSPESNLCQAVYQQLNSVQFHAIVPRPCLVQWWCLQWKLLGQLNW